MSQLRHGGDLGERFIDGLELSGDTHPHVTVHDRGLPLGVEGEEVCGRADLTGRIVGTGGDVAKEAVHQSTAGACDVRSADPRVRQCAAHAVHRIVVQPIKIFGSASPVEVEVRLVPHLEVPALHFVPPVTLDVVAGPFVEQFGPLAVVAGRIGPTGGTAVVSVRSPHLSIGDAGRRGAHCLRR